MNWSTRRGRCRTFADCLAHWEESDCHAQVSEGTRLPSGLLRSRGLVGGSQAGQERSPSPHTSSHPAPSLVEESDLALIPREHVSRTQRGSDVPPLNIQEKEFSEFTSEQLSISPRHLAHLLWFRPYPPPTGPLPNFSHSFPLRVAGRDYAATQGHSGSTVGSLSGRWEYCFTLPPLSWNRQGFCFVLFCASVRGREGGAYVSVCVCVPIQACALESILL